MSVKEIRKTITKTSFLNIKIIALGVLLAALFIGGLCYYFAGNKKPSEQPVKEVIEDNQETIENKEQEEVIINNGYIPVIDCLWLNILSFVIVAALSIAFVIFYICVWGFKVVKNPTEQGGIAWTKAITIFIIFHQLILYIIWFILMLIFAAFSKMWDKEHSWWSNVVKGFFRNRIHRGWWSLIPISLLIIGIISFALTEKKKYNSSKLPVEPPVEQKNSEEQ